LGEYGVKTTAQVIDASFSVGNATTAVFLVSDRKDGKGNMVKVSALICVILLAGLVSGCAVAGLPNDPVIEGYFEGITISDAPPVTLEGDGLIWLEFRPDLDPTKLAVNAKPTMIERGRFIGYSLPIGGADEELFFSMCVPGRWDGESDIILHIRGWLDTAQDDALDAVNLEVHWNYMNVGGVLGAGSNTISGEVVTGIAAQFTMIEIPIIIDYDEDAPPIRADDVLAFHLVRVASSQEIDGEIVIADVGVIYLCDKIGNPEAE